MARISSSVGPSSADVQKEITDLRHKGKIGPSDGKLLEWKDWKASLCGSVPNVIAAASRLTSCIVRNVSSLVQQRMLVNLIYRSPTVARLR